MKIKCNECGAEIKSDNVNLATLIAKCDQCDNVFSFGESMPPLVKNLMNVAAARVASRYREAKPEEVPRPKSVIVEKQGMNLLLTQKWFSLKFIPIALFCVAWDSFLVFWYTIAFTTDAPWIMVVFPVFHLAVGVGLTYYALAGFLNRTIIALNPRDFLVRHGPLPWIGNRELRSDDIAQLFCQEEVNHRRNGSRYTYQLSVLMKDGVKIKLLSGLDSPDVALYLEREIEDWLKIEDRHVTGEMWQG